MPIPKHEDILKTLNGSTYKYGGTTVDLSGTVKKSGNLPFNDSILKTIKDNPTKYKSSASIDFDRKPVIEESVDEKEQEKKGFFGKLFSGLKNISGDITSGMVKLLPRTGVELLNLGTSTIDVAGDLIANHFEQKFRNPMYVQVSKEYVNISDEDYKKLSPGEKVRADAMRTMYDPEKGNEMADKWINFYDNTLGSKTESMKKFTQDLREKPGLVPTEEWSNSTLGEKFLPTNIFETVLYAGPGVIASLGAFALNPIVGFTVSSGAVADDVSTAAQESGLDKDKALRIGVGTGILVGWVDKLVPDEVFSPREQGQFAKGLTKRIVKISLKEAGTEVVQEDIQIGVESTFREDLGWDEIATRNAMSALGGLLGGAGAEVMVSFANGIRNGDIGGVTEQDIEQINIIESNKDSLKSYTENYAKEARDFVEASDFADVVFGTSTESQLGSIDAKDIRSRDPIDRQTVDDYKIRIQNGEVIEPIIMQRSEDGSWETFDGSNRRTAFEELDMKAPVLYTGDEKLLGFKTVGEVYTDLQNIKTQQDIKTQTDVVPETQGIEGETQTATTDEVAEDIAFQEAYAQVFQEVETAEAGQRIPTENAGVIGIPSTFPSWVPEYLRSKSLFEKVLPMLDPANNITPAKNATRQQELYDILQDEIKSRAEGIRNATEAIEKGTEVRQSQQDLGDQRSQQERSETETLDRTLSKDVIEADSTYSKNNIQDNLDKVVQITEDMDKIPPANSTKTVSQDHSGEFTIPETTKWQKFRRTVEDMNIRLKSLNQSIEERTGDSVKEQLDLWAQKDMLPRKQADQIRRIRDIKRDFVERLVLADLTFEELDEYRHALHAKERNAEMNRRRAEIGKPAEEGLSGMKDSEADEILARDNSKMDPFIAELKEFDKHTLKYMVANGLLKKSEAEKINSTYKNYAPLFRDMSEDYTGIGTGQGIATPRSIIKRAKGSDRRVLSTIGNTFHRMERVYTIKLKNDIGKTIVDMTRVYPFLKDTVFTVDKDPVGVLAKRELKAEIDKKFVDDLVGFAEGLGLDVFETEGQPGRKLGYYSPLENKVVRKFATSRETLAHEIGHFLDIRKGLAKRVVKNTTIGLEIYKHSELEVGENPTRLAMPEEQFANAFSWWLTHRDLAASSMPEFHKEITRVINKDSTLKPLLNIKPTASPTLESITEDVWGRIFKVGPNVILTKINGSEYFITVKDPDLARALKNTNLSRVPTWAKSFRTALSIWSGFKTRWRPEFLITNFQRDVGEGLINLSVEQGELGDAGKNLKIDVAKGIPQSQKEIWGYLKGDGNKLVDQFFKDGGDTGHYWLEPVQDAEQSLLKLQKEIQNAGVEKFTNPVRKAGEFVDDAQTMVELGIRFSAYKELIGRGMSPNKAIQAAADLTVNFSRQGEMSPILKSAYGFINPAIQGTSKVARSIASRKGRTRIVKSLGAMTMLGFLTGSLSKLIDKEGDEQMSEWTKNHKLSFSIGNGKEVNLWNMPYGYTTFYAMGRQMSDIAWGTKDFDEATKQVAETAVNSFSPFGTKLNDLWPTLIKPIADINSNDAWYDGKIHPDQIFTKTPKPNSATYFENTSEVAIFISEILNKLTGGDEKTRGVIDIHPDDLEYMYDQYLGGPFEFVTSTFESAATSIGGEFDPNRTPFVRQFYRNGNTQSWSYGVIYDTLDIAYKTDLSDTQKDRFFRAVEIGVEEGVFDQERADGYVRDFVRAVYKIEGSLTDKDNTDAFEKLSKASKDDVEKLINTYAPSSQRTIRRRINNN